MDSYKICIYVIVLTRESLRHNGYPLYIAEMKLMFAMYSLYLSTFLQLFLMVINLNFYNCRGKIKWAIYLMVSSKVRLWILQSQRLCKYKHLKDWNSKGRIEKSKLARGSLTHHMKHYWLKAIHFMIALSHFSQWHDTGSSLLLWLSQSRDQLEYDYHQQRILRYLWILNLKIFT